MGRFSFTHLSHDSAADFAPFVNACRFGDMTFRTLYAWQPVFGYSYMPGQGFLMVSGRSITGQQGNILLRSEGKDISAILQELLNTPQLMNSGRLQLEYIAEEELPLYEAAARILKLRMSVSYEDAFSDYYYEKEAYCSLSGSRQKSLRGDVNALLKQTPGLYMVLYNPKHADAILSVFDDWCSGRRCADCVYGCERNALKRFLEVYSEPECFGALAFSGDRLLSFLIGQVLPGGVFDIHFQKNALRMRGLTYWLSRELILQHPECRCINLEEDMGIPGLRMDKQRLHPCCLRKKYTVLLQP